MGAYNAVAALRKAGRQPGVVGASSGNHAQALALAGRLLDVAVTVVVPRDAPDAKVLMALAPSAPASSATTASQTTATR